MLTFFSKTFTILYIVAIKKNFKLNIGAVLLVTINGSIIKVLLTQHSDSGVTMPDSRHCCPVWLI